MVRTFPCSPSARVMAGVLTGGLLLFAILVPLVLRGARNRVEMKEQKRNPVV